MITCIQIECFRPYFALIIMYYNVKIACYYMCAHVVTCGNVEGCHMVHEWYMSGVHVACIQRALSLSALNGSKKIN